MIPHMVGWDQGPFYLINGVWTAPVLDWLMPAWSRAGDFGAVWLALLGVIAVFDKPTGRTVALAGLFALVLGHVASDVLKELTVRLRPLASLPDVRLLVPEPSSYAFPSGHATSAFSAATGVVLAAKGSLKRVPCRDGACSSSPPRSPTRASTSAFTTRLTSWQERVWGSLAAG